MKMPIHRQGPFSKRSARMRCPGEENEETASDLASSVWRSSVFLQNRNAEARSALRTSRRRIGASSRYIHAYLQKLRAFLRTLRLSLKRHSFSSESRIVCLEQRRQHSQSNGCLDSDSGKIMRSPAAIDGKRHRPSQSSRAPSRSNNSKDRHGLGN